jgi:hypothetical protein
LLLKDGQVKTALFKFKIAAQPFTSAGGYCAVVHSFRSQSHREDHCRGTGRISFTTNNVLVDNSHSTNAGYVVTGIVTLPNGQRAHLLARLRLQIVEGEFRLHSDEFTLRPIGG